MDMWANTCRIVCPIPSIFRAVWENKHNSVSFLLSRISSHIHLQFTIPSSKVCSSSFFILWHCNRPAGISHISCRPAAISHISCSGHCHTARFLMSWTMRSELVHGTPPFPWQLTSEEYLCLFSVAAHLRGVSLSVFRGSSPPRSISVCFRWELTSEEYLCLFSVGASVPLSHHHEAVWVATSHSLEFPCKSHMVSQIDSKID